MGRKFKKYHIMDYSVISEERSVRRHVLDVETTDIERVRKFLALKHGTNTGNIKYISVFPVYFEGFEPKLK